MSCSGSSNKRTGPAFIGGEIVNPKGKSILLFKDDVLLDTVALLKDNTFEYRIENPKAGLYSFQHNEFQMFYLEPGDSLMFRVNTMDFDESLHYSGKGAKENNFLMDLFLQNEEDAKTLANYYMLSPAAFEQKLDSVNTKIESRGFHLIKEELNFNIGL